MKPENTQQIVIGGLLVGKGKMWLDNFNVTVDGKEIKDLKPFVRKILPAENDKEFDKGSQISTISIDKSQIENLKTLGLIWGFLKYYHPNIAKGEYNWDYELFRILPKVQNSKNKEECDEMLTKWINGLGKYKEGKESKVDLSTVKIEPDLAWISNSKLSNELSALLLKIKKN